MVSWVSCYRTQNVFKWVLGCEIYTLYVVCNNWYWAGTHNRYRESKKFDRCNPTIEESVYDSSSNVALVADCRLTGLQIYLCILTKAGLYHLKSISRLSYYLCNNKLNCTFLNTPAHKLLPPRSGALIKSLYWTRSTNSWIIEIWCIFKASGTKFFWPNVFGYVLILAKLIAALSETGSLEAKNVPTLFTFSLILSCIVYSVPRLPHLQPQFQLLNIYATTTTQLPLSAINLY